MTLLCIVCGERALAIVQYISGKGAYGRRKDRALYECTKCGHKERVT